MCSFVAPLRGCTQAHNMHDTHTLIDSEAMHDTTTLITFMQWQTVTRFVAADGSALPPEKCASALQAIRVEEAPGAGFGDQGRATSAHIRESRLDSGLDSLYRSKLSPLRSEAASRKSAPLHCSRPEWRRRRVLGGAIKVLLKL